MAQLNRHQTVILAGKEAGYGTEQTTPTDKIASMFEWDYGVQSFDVAIKTQTLAPMTIERGKGRKMPTCTLSGILTDAHQWILEAAIGDNATPLTIPATDSGYSYTIYCAVPASSADAGDGVKVTGARCESLTLSRNGDFINFEASFRAKAIVDWASLDGLTLTSVTDTTTPENTPFLWQDVVVSLANASYSNANDLSITITNTFADDDVLYQNSESKVQDVICSTTGELTYQAIYDTVKDPAIAALIESVDPAEIFESTISFVSDDATWTFTINGREANPARPDDAKCIYVTDHIVTMLGDSTTEAISVAIS
jgi:hypothetical protein